MTTHNTVALAAALLIGAAAIAAAAAVFADGPPAGNQVLRVAVEDSPGRDGAGAFTVATGPGHPAGDAREILFGEDGPYDAATSYITLRSYTTGTDYVQTARGPASAYLVRPLDAIASVQALPSGYRAAYNLADAGQPDALTLVNDIVVEGSTVGDTVVRLTSTIANTGSFPLDIGLRYLLDVAPYGDDGPARAAPLSDVFGVTETEVPDSAIALWGPSQPAVTISRTGSVAADRAAYAYWPEAFQFAWDYTVRDRDIGTDGGLNDVAMLYYFGATRAEAVRLGPGQSVAVSLVLALEASNPGVVTATPTPSPASTASATPAARAPVRTPAALPRTGR